MNLNMISPIKTLLKNNIEKNDEIIVHDENAIDLVYNKAYGLGFKVINRLLMVDGKEYGRDLDILICSRNYVYVLLVKRVNLALNFDESRPLAEGQLKKLNIENLKDELFSGAALVDNFLMKKKIPGLCIPVLAYVDMNANIRCLGNLHKQIKYFYLKPLEKALQNEMMENDKRLSSNIFEMLNSNRKLSLIYSNKNVFAGVLDGLYFMDGNLYPIHEVKEISFSKDRTGNVKLNCRLKTGKFIADENFQGYVKFKVRHKRNKASSYELKKFNIRNIDRLIIGT